MKSIQQPSETEFSILKNISIKDLRLKVRIRAKIILEKIKGISNRIIAKILNCDKNTVNKWIKRWVKDGIGAILSWKSVKYNMKQVKRRMAVEKLVETTPESLKLPFNTWSLQKLSSFFGELIDFDISPATLSRDLRLLNINYRKVKDTFIDKPVDYDIKKAYLTYFKHYLPPNWKLIYIDEKGPVHALRHSGRTWSITQPFRDKRQKSKGKKMFLGGYDHDKDEIHMIQMDYNDSGSLCEALDLIKLEFLQNPYKHLLLIFDNAPIHHSEFTTKYLQEDPQIDYFYLPAYSPELNPIERVFKHYQEELLANGTFSSFEDLIMRTEIYCDYYNTLRKEIYAKEV